LGFFDFFGTRGLGDFLAVIKTLRQGYLFSFLVGTGLAARAGAG